MKGQEIRVLVVEDEIQMRRFLRTALTAREFHVTEAETLREARIFTTTHPPEIILLDLGLPDGDGLDFIVELRGWCHIPIIVISARGCEDDKVIALNAGADDYLTKPFGVNELTARIRVALRHAVFLQTNSSQEAVLEIGPLRLDPARREVQVNNCPITLTPIEYRLLLLFSRNAGRVLTHRYIMKEVWGVAYAEQTHTLRVFMSQLRRKVENNPNHPKLLMTEMGIGYRMRDTWE